MIKEIIKKIILRIYPNRCIQTLLNIYVKVLKRQQWPGRHLKTPYKGIIGNNRLEDPFARGMSAALIFSRTWQDPEHSHHKIGSGRMQQEVFACLNQVGFTAEFAGAEDRVYSDQLLNSDLLIVLITALPKIFNRIKKNALTAIFTCNTYAPVALKRLLESMQRWRLPFEGFADYYIKIPTYIKAYNQADYLLIAENEQGINNFLANGIPAGKIKRYNNFCDDDVWVPGRRRREKFTFVVWASGLGIRKGLPALTAAWKEWFRGQAAELHIFGVPTPTTDRMFKGLKEGSPAPGLFLHLDLIPAQDPRIIKFLGASHVGVYPTLEDAQPSSLLEMASCGLPIITTRESGVDFHADFCRYVAPDSVVELQEALQYWYERRAEIDEAGKKSRLFIKKHHTKEVLHKRFREIIYEIMTGN